MRRFVEIKGTHPDPVKRRAFLGQLFRGGLGAWENPFRTKLGIEIRDWSNEWERITEIFARRHAHVHQGGVVDAAYREITGSSEMIGMPLLLSTDYLNEANDILTALAIGALYRRGAMRSHRFDIRLQECSTSVYTMHLSMVVSI
jgi:hypothetical protein